MSKIIRQENYRVVITPSGYGYIISSNEEVRNSQLKGMCEDIVKDVKHHIDNIENVLIKWDTVETCSFCGGGWEVNEDENDDTWGLGEPVCCKKAQKEWKKTKTMCKRVEAAAFTHFAMGLLGYKS